MARGTQHRKRRPAKNAHERAVAAPARKQKAPQWQEELFFVRLRLHAKWAYVFLAAAFMLTFVFLGVGSGSNGITDALQNAFHFGSGGTSISNLQSKADHHPQDAQAWRDLATALEQKQLPKDAAAALVRYTALRPKDQGALAELASQYSALANSYASDYTAAQQAATSQSPPDALFAPAPTTPFGQAFTNPTALQDPISTAVSAIASAKQATAYSSYQSAQRSAVATYQKLVALNPKDATTQIQLGQAAQAAQDPQTAIAAFTAFLKLAPSDPLAPQVKQAIASLRAQLAATPTATNTTGAG